MKCKNCNSLNLSGIYCARCGQKLAINLNPTMRDALHDGIHEFFHLDGKIFKTLKYLFFFPGALTREYFLGRRASFINPIRVYLTMSVLHFIFISLSFLPKSGGFIVKMDVDNSKENMSTKKNVPDKVHFFNLDITDYVKTIKPTFDKGIEKMTLDNGRGFKKIFSSAMSKSLFLLLPVFALFLSLTYYSHKEKTYLQFLYFSIHFHAALFGGLIIAHLCNIFFNSDFALLAWLLWAIAYFFKALKTTWNDSSKSAALRSFFMLTGYGFFFILVLASIALYSAYQLGLET